MSAPSKALVLALALVGFLLVGCAPSSDGTGTGACDYDYSRLMVPGWKFYKQLPLEAIDPDKDTTTQCVVLYQVDVPRPNSERRNFPDQTPKVVQVLGSVHRRDRDRSPDIHQYELKLPYDMYLGKRNVSARLGNVLSGSPERELIIEDKDADEVVIEASIFKWNDQLNSEDSSYEPLGWFIGTAGIKVETDKVTTLDWWPCCGWQPESRSLLVQRKEYVPRDKNDYRKDNHKEIIDPNTVDLISLAMPPDDALVTAEYPEKLLFAFYESLPMVYSETVKLHDWMSPGTLASWMTIDTRTFGCLADPQLNRVSVQNIDVSRSRGIPNHIHQIDYSQTDIIVVQALCRFNVGSKKPDSRVTLEWPIRWDWKVDTRTGKWQLQRPIVKP